MRAPHLEEGQLHVCVAEERMECKKLGLWNSSKENGVVQFDEKRLPRCNLPVVIVTIRNSTGKSMHFL
jgi:hypothetical protein